MYSLRSVFIPLLCLSTFIYGLLQPPDPSVIPYDLLYLSRTIPDGGSVYYAAAKGLPGVGPYSKCQSQGPGHLIKLNTDGTKDTLINGAAGVHAEYLITDVQAFDLDYDGDWIVFSGLTTSDFPENNKVFPNAWRLFIMHIDGTQLRQLTGVEGIAGNHQDPDLSQFGGLANHLSGYDDNDPVWLPDGRIAFSSTRYPQFAMYNAVRASNLHVVDADGKNLHRITTEKNGADRPLVDPVTGKIVFARWWRNFRLPTHDTSTIVLQADHYLIRDGLASKREYAPEPKTKHSNNTFALGVVRPDGTKLAVWSSYFREFSANNAYGGSFDGEGNLISNWFPIEHQTESSGFGGLKRHYRGLNRMPDPIIGITSYFDTTLVYEDPNNQESSFGVYHGPYACEPHVLPDGQIVYSHAGDYHQDYNLYLYDPATGASTMVLEDAGRSLLLAKSIRARVRPPTLADRAPAMEALVPPANGQPLDQDGTFVFDCQNIFFNAEVDHPSESAPPVGNVGSVRFFADPQRIQTGSIEALDWPILYAEVNVDSFGRVLEPHAPANLPLFEQARSPHDQGYHVPPIGGGVTSGAAHVIGLNFGRPNEVVKCVGCHTGHSAIPVPESADELLFTNLAPGATISASSEHHDAGYAIDRKVNSARFHWTTEENQYQDPWLELRFLVPIWARELVFYDPPAGAGSTTKLLGAKVLFYDSDTGHKPQDSIVIDNIDATPKHAITFPVRKVRRIKIEIENFSGSMYHWPAAGVAEIEVIGSHVDPDKFSDMIDCHGDFNGIARLGPCGDCLELSDPAFDSCQTAGIEEWISVTAEDISIYASPASTSLTIRGLLGLYSIEILDQDGAVLQEYPTDQSELHIDLSQFPAGLLFLKIVHNENAHLHVVKIIRV